MSNPLLGLSPPIPFPSIRAEHVEPAVDRLLEEAQARIERIAGESAPPTYANVMDALEASTEELELVMTVVGHLEGVATTDELRAAHNVVRPKVSAFFSSIPTNAALWERLKAFSATDEAAGLDPTRARFLKKTTDGFRRAGADLSPEKKEKLLAMDVELSKLTNSFSQNTLDATNAWDLLLADEAQLAGLPESAREAARENAASKGLDGWRFTLQAPSLIPLLTYLDDASLRKQAWRAFSTRASSGDFDNRPIIARILELRRAKAELLGYTDFSDLVLEDRMAKEGSRAAEFLADLERRCRPSSEREHGELAAFRRSLEGDDAPELAPWDVAYYAEKQRKALYDFDEEELRPYFPVERVLGGLFDVVNRLYGITVEEAQMPVWDEHVRTYAMKDADGRHVASFYVDLFPRENKRSGAWMNPLYNSVPENGSQGPHLGLFCANVTPPVGGRPALLDHRNVETLFHEFGHLVHHCSSRVTVRSLAGANVAWDFVELPSQIMENWCWEKDALDLFARHWETDETIPGELFERMSRARTYRAASGMMRQLGFGTTDLRLHREYDPATDGDVMDYARATFAAFMPTPLPKDYAMITSFGHLFAGAVGYAAGYYSYLWAEVLDADAFARFKEEGIFDRRVGQAFFELLSKGDSEDPMDLYVAFRGREPKLDALLARNGLA